MELKKYKLGEILELQRGYDLPSSLMKKGDVLVAGSNGVIGYHNEARSNHPCITVGRSGSVGKVHYYEQATWAHNTTLFVKDFKGNNPQYLYYFLKNLHLDKMFVKGSSVVPSLDRKVVHSLIVPFYKDVVDQKRIALVLSNIDRKIEINRAINQNLEAMAKQLYDYWFVQFDFPNEDGKPYKSSGGEMVWNEKLKREIPKEWEVLNLGQITTSYQQGLIRSNNQLSDNSEFGYLKMGDLDGKGQYSLQKLARTNATSEEVFLFSLHKGDFLINVRNSKEIVGKTCLIDYVEENTLFNHMLVRMSFDKVTSFYMNLLFNTDFMYRAMDGLKQGTTTVIALYQEDLYRLPIVVPTKNVMDTFSIIEKSILNQKELLTNEIISLIKQRDELLPLLMNGQVSVNSDLSAY